MKKELPIILLILIVNLFLGYLFQISNQTTCFTELSILGLGGVIFWMSLFDPLKRFTRKLIDKNGLQKNNLLTLGGVGIASSVINLFFCQFFIIGIFSLVFNCVSPSFNTLTASLTNNMAGNFIIYLALIGLIIKDHSPEQKPLTVNSEDLKTAPKDHLFLSYDKTMVKVFFQEISHVQVVNNTILISTQKRHFIKYQSLKSFLEELPDDTFKRIHRSSLVNLNYVQSVETNSSGDGKMYLKNGVELRFSRSYKKNFWRILPHRNNRA